MSLLNLISQTNGLQEEVRKYFEKKNLPLERAVTFKDVGIWDTTSRIVSRSNIKDFRTKLSKNITLNFPVTPANMSDVCGAEMCIGIARIGGIGFVPPFGSVEEQCDEIRKVKRADNNMIRDPWRIPETFTMRQAFSFMSEKATTGVLVVDAEDRLVGILTNRDVRFLRDLPNEELDKMIVRDKMITDLTVGSLKTSFAEAENILDVRKIEKLPIVENGKPVGLIVAKDIIKSRRHYPQAVRDKDGRLLVGGTIGVSSRSLQEAERLLYAGADVMLLDTARANAFSVAEITTEFKKKFPLCDLIVGNVDTPDGARLLIDAGADGIKVGIGPGSPCSTRIETGVGVPQITAIAFAVAAGCAKGIPVIADGGMEEGHQFAKAFVAGASVLMMGGYFAGTEESPGVVVVEKGRKTKRYRGSASTAHQLSRLDSGDLDRLRAAEGKEGLMPLKGSVEDVIQDMRQKLQSAMSYCDSYTLEEFHRSRFFEQTRAGFEEGLPRI